MNIHSSTDDFQIWGYVVFVGIVKTIYNPILVAQIKFNKKAFNGCLFYRNKSCWCIFTNKEQDATPIFVAINSEEFTIKPLRANWSTGKVSSSFVSEIIITSALPLTCEARISNLILIELMLIWAKISLFRLFFLITVKVHSTYLANSVSELSDMHPFKNKSLLETSLQ